MPPLAGPRSMECCTRNPLNVPRVPSSICTGICTMISPLGSRNIFHRPSSSSSFFAARSDRATCASQGLTSSRYAVAIQTPLHGAICWCLDPKGSHSLPRLPVVRLGFLQDGDTGFASFHKEPKYSLGEGLFVTTRLVLARAIAFVESSLHFLLQPAMYPPIG